MRENLETIPPSPPPSSPSSPSSSSSSSSSSRLLASVLSLYKALVTEKHAKDADVKTEHLRMGRFDLLFPHRPDFLHARAQAIAASPSALQTRNRLGPTDDSKLKGGQQQQQQPQRNNKTTVRGGAAAGKGKEEAPHGRVGRGNGKGKRRGAEGVAEGGGITACVKNGAVFLPLADGGRGKDEQEDEKEEGEEGRMDPEITHGSNIGLSVQEQAQSWVSKAEENGGEGAGEREGGQMKEAGGSRNKASPARTASITSSTSSSTTTSTSSTNGRKRPLTTAKGGSRRKKAARSPVALLLDRNASLLPSTVTPYVTPLLLRNPDDLLLFETAKIARMAAANAKAKTAAKVRAAAVAAAANVRAVAAAAAAAVVHALPGGKGEGGEGGEGKAVPPSVPEMMMPPPLIVNGEGPFRQSQQQPLQQQQQQQLLHHMAVIPGGGEEVHEEGEGGGGGGGGEQVLEDLERRITVFHQEEKSQRHHVGFLGVGDRRDMQIGFPGLAGEMEYRPRRQGGEGVLAMNGCGDITCVVAV
eukprot:evm.model.NODE_50220_length_46951_cov_42.727013.1